ncbi:NUDIX domain-containing protein [Patescibacteria group bacterium]|nr:NUDIX domain-containing protein [Patescibacteria group bacterium]
MQHLKLINHENVTEEVANGYRKREAVRAIVFDKDNLVGILHATKNDYYKLPGGGIDSGEDQIDALKRECLEEIGSNVDVGKEIGLIVEYRSQQNLKQISYCYLAKVVGEKKTPELTDNEISEGFVQVWLPFEEAKKKLSESPMNVYEATYMVTRDSTFINEAGKILTEKH